MDLGSWEPDWAWIFFYYTDLFPKKTSLIEAMLFLGASMCITAFPVLARIIHYKKLSGTAMGTVALGAGAIDDASAWCLLAVVLASFDKNWNHALANIGGGLAYVAVTLLVVRPFLVRAKKWLVKPQHALNAPPRCSWRSRFLSLLTRRVWRVH